MFTRTRIIRGKPYEYAEWRWRDASGKVCSRSRILRKIGHFIEANLKYEPGEKEAQRYMEAWLDAQTAQFLAEKAAKAAQKAEATKSAPAPLEAPVAPAEVADKDAEEGKLGEYGEEPKSEQPAGGGEKCE